MSKTRKHVNEIERPLLTLDGFCWLLTNWGRPWSVHWTRKQAIKNACEATGESWSETRKSFELRKCRVEVLP